MPARLREAVPDLILGPLLRYAGETDATVWVETGAACEVEVLVGGSWTGATVRAPSTLRATTMLWYTSRG